MLLKLIARIISFLFLLTLALALLFFADDIFIYREQEPAGILKEAEMESQAVDFSVFASQLEQELEIEVGAKERPKPEPKPAPAASGNNTGGATAKEQQMVGLVNQARANAGLPPLQVSSQLTKAARAKSRDMIEKNYFSHTSPTYGSFTDLLSYFGISYRSAAENLAMNSNGSVTGAHDMLMASPGHRTNILGGSYSHIGVGIQVRGDGSLFYTQLFVGY